MKITRLKHHDRCTVHVVFGRSHYHTAHLECVDSRCTRKNKFIQWVSHATADELKLLGVKSRNLSEEFANA